PIDVFVELALRLAEVRLVGGWLGHDRGGRGGCNTRAPASSARVRSATLAPASMSCHAVHSAEEWLRPCKLGTKIIPTRVMPAMICASWTAPLGIRRRSSP